MASDEQKAANERLRKEAIFNTLAAAEAEAETDAFQCGRCKQVSAFVKLRCQPEAFSSGKLDTVRLRRDQQTSQ
jgi:hypothetical protein